MLTNGQLPTNIPPRDISYCTRDTEVQHSRLPAPTRAVRSLRIFPSSFHDTLCAPGSKKPSRRSARCSVCVGTVDLRSRKQRTRRGRTRRGSSERTTRPRQARGRLDISLLIVLRIIVPGRYVLYLDTGLLDANSHEFGSNGHTH